MIWSWHKIAVETAFCAILASLMPALVSARMGAGGSVALRTDGPSVDPKAAEQLSPEAVGNLLLAPGHPPVTDVRIGPEFMVPYPPGVKIPTRFELHLKPFKSREPGFCERTIAIVHLASVDQLPDRSVPSSRPDTIETRTGYQWAGRAKESVKGCGEPKRPFLVPKPEERADALRLIRILASAQARARRVKRQPYLMSVEDSVGPGMREYQREHPEDEQFDWEVFTDPHKALLAVPLDAVSYAGPSSAFSPNILTEDDRGRMSLDMRTASVFAGGEWTIGMILRGDEIILMRMQRAIPPPF